MSRGVHGNLRAVIATALSVEFQAVVRHLSGLHEVRHPAGTIYEVGSFRSGTGEWTVAVLEAGPGNPTAAAEVERAIQHFDPSCVLFVGIAGGVKDVAVGDVVAGTKIYGYESGKAEGRFHVGPAGADTRDPGDQAKARTESEFRPRPAVAESTYSLVQIARSVARRADWLARIFNVEGMSAAPTPKAYLGPIAAGEKVVASTASDIFALLRSAYGDALAVEMEGYGFARAAHANAAVAALVVRGISDLVDGKSEADAGGSHEVASRHAAAFAFEVLARVSVPSASTPRGDVPSTHRADGAGDTRGLADRTVAALATADPADWRALSDLAASLYPRGPSERAIWSRAGGDISALPLGATGKADWFAAVTELRHGGGGPSITPGTLLREFLEEYPANRAAADLAQRFRTR